MHNPCPLTTCMRWHSAGTKAGGNVLKVIVRSAWIPIEMLGRDELVVALTSGTTTTLFTANIEFTCEVAMA